MGSVIDELEGIGWKVRGDYIPPEPNRTSFFPRFWQAIEMIPLLIRFLIYTLREWFHGREVFIDVLKQYSHNIYTGVPIGGIGCGSIGTDFRGGFNRFAITPGMKEADQANVKEDQFILTIHSETNEYLYQSILSCAKFSNLGSWKSHIDPRNVRYRGLYPRAWREFRIPELALVLVCEQLSPVLTNEYKDSSLPTTLFNWTIFNNSSHKYRISLTFSFRNGTGKSKWRKEGKCSSKSFVTETCTGIRLDHSVRAMPVSYALAVDCNEKDKTHVYTTSFHPNSANRFWRQLQEKGSASGLEPDEDTSVKELVVAVTKSFEMPSKSQNCSLFNLTWHMPKVHFSRDKTREYLRWYTKFFCVSQEETANTIADYAISQFTTWRNGIELWQKPIVDDALLPEWYRSALFNELYFMTDGGSVWVVADEGWRKTEDISDQAMKQYRAYGRFAYLESWDYLMFTTYDVHFYSSWALIRNWPQLQLSVQMDFCDQFYREDTTVETSMKEGAKMIVKTKNRIPHDIGHPVGDPWVKSNAYLLHDTAAWRDLNLKFILLCWRDWKMIVEDNFDEAEAMLKFFYVRCVDIVDRALDEWDFDHDGMIENSNIADQTYDVWTMSGTSAYCGSLWLASVYSVIKMAKHLKKRDDIKKYEDIFHRAKDAYIKKLWNGKYFHFDENPKNSGTIMSDQLCGEWFQSMMADTDLIGIDRVKQTLKTIYDFNVCKFFNGTLGPVNGMRECVIEVLKKRIDPKTVSFRESGKFDISSIQSEEVWTGTAYALASFMIANNLVDEGFHTAKSTFESVWHRFGMQYQTPEAISGKKYYRAIGYMRPLSVWSIDHVLQQKKNKN